MKSKKLLIKLPFCLLLFTSNLVSAQDNKDKVLLEIDKKPVTVREFETIYRKNTPKEEASDKKSLQEYLDLYVNFKLKVREAEEAGLDTTSTFKNELNGYKQQLAQPYLVDKEVNEKLILEAFERMNQDVRASHILLKLNPNPLPKDTLAAYQKIMKIRARIQKGEDFNKVAKETSEDPSAKENFGDLGYFTAFQMVYPFECAVFLTPVNEISMPVRTRFGYHLVKVTDKRKAQGQILAAHIMVKSATGAPAQDSINAKTKIDEIYAKVQAGEDFAELAKQFSDDQGSAKKGGELPWFGTGRMVAEFEKAAFSLKNKGDMHAPIKTMFGWHIIKKIDQKEIGTFDQLKPELKNKISKDSRSEKSKDSFIAKVKKEYNFKENAKSRDDLFKVMDTTLLDGKWKGEKFMAMNKPLFTLMDNNFTQSDFIKYLESRQSKSQDRSLQGVYNNLYNGFVTESCMAFEEGRLMVKYPEFKALMQEYRDGILLFELTDKKVWSKAVKDSTGLNDFYEKNKNNYLWDERVDASIYFCDNEEVAKNVRKMLVSKKKSMSNDEILAEINKDSQLTLKIETGKFQKGDNDAMDAFPWLEGTTENKIIDKKTVFAVINKKYMKEPKTLAESRGLVTADYQNYLEKEWVEQLRKKYQVKVNQEVLNTIQ